MLPVVLGETVLTFAQAAAACPSIGGRRPSTSTVYSWCDIGIRVGKQRVKLECAKVGGKRVTSREALDRFFAATTARETDPSKVDRTPAARRKSSEKAMAFLKSEFAKV